MDPAPAPAPVSGPSTAVLPSAPPLRVIAGLNDIAPPASPWTSTWPRPALLAAAVLLGSLLTLLFVAAVSYFGGRPAEGDQAPPARVDLNRASAAELRTLPGIGPKLAEAIVERRDKNGPFKQIEELRKVTGVGPAVLERLRPFVTVEATESQPQPAKPTPARSAEPKAKKAAAKAPSKKAIALGNTIIDVNRAALPDLLRLPGIGPKKAQGIINEREKRLFQTVDELRRVSGIGPGTLEELRPHVTVGPADD